MNPKIERITSEIEKLKVKMAGHQQRLRDLERQKTELENADIISAVRGVDIAPDEFAAFVRMFKEKQGGALPDLEAGTNARLDDGTDTMRQTADKIQNDKEDEPIEN